MTGQGRLSTAPPSPARCDGRPEPGVRAAVDRTLSIAAAVVLMLWAACSGCSASSGWQAGERMAVAGELADLGTTAYAIQSGAGTESNPVYGSDDNAVLVGLAVTAALHLVVRYWLADKPETTQRQVWGAISCLRFGVAGWNVSQVQGSWSRD